jgi:DNA adenine methylase
MKNVSPLRYPGGKTRACKLLDKVTQEHFNLDDYNSIISPFFGGGSFEFFLQNKYNKELIVNDKFTPLYNFWHQVKNNKLKLCDELYKINNVSKDDFINYRNIIMTREDILEQAKLYFIINRCSFSGATLSGGYSSESSKKRFTKSSIDRINKLQLNNMNIYNLDMLDFISMYCKDNTFMFLDPPYYLKSKSKLYGLNGDMHELFNHVELFNMIKNKKNWLMTYNNCEYIKEMYKGFIIIETNWSYGMNSTKKSSEIIIISK